MYTYLYMRLFCGHFVVLKVAGDMPNRFNDLSNTWQNKVCWENDGVTATTRNTFSPLGEKKSFTYC